MEDNMKTILPKEYEPKLDEAYEFVRSLDSSGQKSFLEFIQGARFMQHLMSQAGQSSA